MSASILKRFRGEVFAGLNQLAARFGYRFQRQDHPHFFEALLERLLREKPDPFFIQIGANDGIAADPIREFVTRHRLAGLALEPLPDIYAKLVANYRDYPRVRPVNLALHQTEKSLELHRVDPAKGAQLGDWAQGIASFRASHHQLTGTAAEFIIKERVDCTTFEELLQAQQVAAFDLLQIDTEGYDGEILKMVDFERHQPALIRFEHGLSDGVMSREAFQECADRLLGHGYFLAMEAYDAVAYRPGLLL